MKDTSVVISLGSNYGDRRKAVEEAKTWLSDLLDNYKHSETYETLPVGRLGNNYYNSVVSGIFHGSKVELENKCKEYERSRGRDEASRAINRVPVDIDIVIADGEIIRQRDFSCNFFQKGYKEISELY